jgi:hypothetical protein
MKIFNEVQQLEELTVIGKALVKYAASVEPGLVFERQDGWWTPPIERNFVGFRFQWSDTLSITLNLYGSPEEQFRQDDLVVRKSRFNYSKCRITDESQLMAATVCIWRAHQLFHRERHVETGGLILIDEAQTLLMDDSVSRPAQTRNKAQQHGNMADTTAWSDETGNSSKNHRLLDSSFND